MDAEETNDADVGSGRIKSKGAVLGSYNLKKFDDRIVVIFWNLEN